MIEFDCPNCRKHYKASDAMAGRELKCGNCNSPVHVPPTATAPLQPESIEGSANDEALDAFIGELRTTSKVAGDRSAERRTAPSDSSSLKHAKSSTYANRPITSSGTILEKTGWKLVLVVLLPQLLPSYGEQMSSQGIWLVAAIGTAVGYYLLKELFSPSETDHISAVAAFLFTAFIGIVILNGIQSIAAANASKDNTHGIAAWIFKIIGSSYRTVEMDVGFFEMLIAMTLSVGLCEEIVKLLPAVYLLRTTSGISACQVLFVAGASGLGFGIAEGMHYSTTLYLPLGAPTSMYVVRYLSCASSHALLSIIGSALLLNFRKQVTAPNSSFHVMILFIAGCSLLPAFPHALGNTLLHFDFPVAAAIVDTLLVLIVLVCVTDAVDAVKPAAASTS